VSPDGEFSDFEDGDGPDDSGAVESYVGEVVAAVEAFGVPTPGDLL
jgi:hypothetical protein